MDEHYRILDRLIERKLFHVRLCYNTNFSTLSFKGYDLYGMGFTFGGPASGGSSRCNRSSPSARPW